jgi:hypothetical protein
MPTQLFAVCEIGTIGKIVCRVFLRRSAAENFTQGKSAHLFKIEERTAPGEYAPPTELFAAHSYEPGYKIHRFSEFHSDYEEAKRQAGEEGLVLLMVPED